MAKKKRYYAKKESMESASDPRRRLEGQDSRMINEDMNACANLPQNVIYREWPKAPYGMNYDLDDTIGVIDVQIHRDSDKRKSQKQMFPEKY